MKKLAEQTTYFAVCLLGLFDTVGRIFCFDTLETGSSEEEESLSELLVSEFESESASELDSGLELEFIEEESLVGVRAAPLVRISIRSGDAILVRLFAL